MTLNGQLPPVEQESINFTFIKMLQSQIYICIIPSLYRYIYYVCNVHFININLLHYITKYNPRIYTPLYN